MVYSFAENLVMNKSKFLNSQLETIARHIQVVTDFGGGEYALLSKKPKEAAWNALECLEHLNSYARYYMPVLQQAVVSADSSWETEIKFSFMGKYFIKMMDPAQQSKHYKAAKKHLPVAVLEVKNILSEFLKHQYELMAIVDNLTSKSLSKKKIPVSVMKILKLNIADTLAFLTIHNERHIQQAIRAIEGLSEMSLNSIRLLRWS